MFHVLPSANARRKPGVVCFIDQLYRATLII